MRNGATQQDIDITREKRSVAQYGKVRKDSVAVLSKGDWDAIEAREEKNKMDAKNAKEKRFLCSYAVQPVNGRRKVPVVKQVCVSRMQDDGLNPRRCAVHEAPGTMEELSTKTLDELKALKWRVRWSKTEEGAWLLDDFLPFDHASIGPGDSEISGDRLARSLRI
jgi:hypothetical protein